MMRLAREGYPHLKGKSLCRERFANEKATLRLGTDPEISIVISLNRSTTSAGYVQGNLAVARGQDGITRCEETPSYQRETWIARRLLCFLGLRLRRGVTDLRKDPVFFSLVALKELYLARGIGCATQFAVDLRQAIVVLAAIRIQSDGSL